jgi:hypothetical protein
VRSSAREPGSAGAGEQLPRRLPLSLALWLLAGAASLAQAQQPQDEGPVVIGAQKPNWKGFQLVRLDAALDLWGQWRKDELKQAGRPTLTETEATYRQTLDLSGEAYIGHKNLIDISGAGKIGLEEEDLHSDDSQNSTGYVAVTALGEISALILGNGPVPTTAYAKRDEVNTHQDFGGTIKTTTTEFGAIAQFRSAVIPTQLQVLHREQDQEDQLGRGGFSFTQDSAILHSDARLTTNQHLLLDYTFDHIHESNTSGFRDTYDQHDATATHMLNFGASNHDWLRSSLHLLERDGAFSEQIVHLDEDMFLEHTPRLDTRYKLSLEDVTHQDQEQRQARGSAQIRHRLFDSLTSTGTVGAGVLDVPDEFTSNEYFVSGSLDYTKKVPFGRFDAGLNLATTRQDNGARGTTVAISNRTFVFNDPFPVVISQRNIMTSSIVVRDTARLRVFINGADYTVTSFPDRVELHRVVGGAIANGQAVSVDYDVGPEPANTIDSTTGSISLRYDISEGALSGLGLFAIYRRLDQSVDSTQPAAFILEDFNEFRYGADYHIGGFIFTAERTDHNSNVSPYDATRLVAQYDRRFSRNNVLSLSLSWEDLEYRLTGQEVQLILGTGRWSQRVTEDLDFSLHSEARQEYHNDAPDIHGFNAGLDISWHKRQTTVYASVFASILDSGATTTTSGTVSVGLKRAF